MVDGNIVDCNMHGYVQDKQKETCIGSKKTHIGSIIIFIFSALTLLPCVPSVIDMTPGNSWKIVSGERTDISHNYSLIFVPKVWLSDKWMRRTIS